MFYAQEDISREVSHLSRFIDLSLRVLNNSCMPDLSFLKNDFERAEYLQNILISRATGGSSATDSEYKELRAHFLQSSQYKDELPDFVRTKRDLDHFWSFIKTLFPSYEERRRYIWDGFSSFLDNIESMNSHSVRESLSQKDIKKFGSNVIHHDIQKALERATSDPEGAITLSRTILESTCKFICDECGIKYEDKTDLSVLYKKAADQLNLSPDQHNEKVFKQILGSCSGVVNGLGTLRNRLGDAHGKGSKSIKPLSRHAELATGLAGTMAIFLMETYEAKKADF